MALPTFEPDAPIRCRDYRIGCIGAGFIMADVHLAAYKEAGFPVQAIASRTQSKAQGVADRWGIPVVHPDPAALIRDPAIEIVDIAYPPHLQRELIELAAAQPHVKGILAQKPLAADFAESRAVVEHCEAAGKTLSVNQNMRYDQSIRVLKQLLDEKLLGDPVVATIEMRAIPHWQEYLKPYERLTLLNMSVHHIDVMRFLFGEVAEIFCTTRPDPRSGDSYVDGIVAYTLNFQSGVMGLCLDDIWASPVGDDFDSDIYIKWRVEGTEGLAQGTIGWPDYPDGSPSTATFCCPATGGKWVTPAWETMWFPHAFKGVMEQLQWALKQGEEPALSGRDNLRTMALVEAAYQSIAQKRSIDPATVT